MARIDLETLYRENAERMVALAFQLTGDHALAEDVVQESFIAAHKGLKGFRGESSPSTWLYRIAIRTANRLRERSRRDRMPGPPGARGGDEAPGKDRPPRDEIEELLLALEALPEDQRVVLSLMNLRGLGVSQIAEVLEIPEGTVWSRASLARRRMRQWLAARAGRHEQAARLDLVAPRAVDS